MNKEEEFVKAVFRNLKQNGINMHEKRRMDREQLYSAVKVYHGLVTKDAVLRRMRALEDCGWIKPVGVKTFMFTDLAVDRFWNDIYFEDL